MTIASDGSSGKRNETLCAQISGGERKCRDLRVDKGARREMFTSAKSKSVGR